MSATQMSNLSHLPHDVLVVIAKRLKKHEDFVCFRCVSKSLCAAAKDEYFDGLRKGMPYLMLPVRDDGDDDVRELYSLVEGESMVASVKAPNLKTMKCFESLGWLLAVREDGNMSLFDPFSDTAEIPLPHQNTLLEKDVGRMNALVFIQKMVLSARPSETSDFVLMVICGGLGYLAYWRLGDNTWNKIEKRKGLFRDVVYHGKGKFYAICNPGDVWVLNLAGNDNQARGGMIIRCESILPDYSSMDPRLVYESTDLYYAYGSYNLYLLKTVDDALLLITRILPDLSEDRSSYITAEFHVYELDIALKSWKEIYSLGSMAVFLGHNSTIAVDASRFSGGVIKPNHIYFTEDEYEYYFFLSPKGGGTDMGVYNLETRTVEPIYPGEPLCSKVSTTIWINPCI